MNRILLYTDVNNYQFFAGVRLDPNVIWKQYSEGKQTYGQLALKYGRCPRTIQRKVNLAEVVTEKKNPRSIVVLMDTTYWGRNFVSLRRIFKDALPKENLLKYYVVNETNALYIKGIRELVEAGFTVTAICLRWIDFED